MKQKEIFYANLDPVKGNEQRGLRPVVIISGNTMNTTLGIFIVCPLTTTIKDLPSRIFIQKNNTNNLKHDSDVLIFHVRTIAKERLSYKTGEITSEQLNDIIAGLNNILKY